MRITFLRSLVVAGVGVGSVVVLSCSAERPATDDTVSGPSTPDLSGVWLQRAAGPLSNDVPPLQPWAEERTRANIKAGPDEDPETRCFPSGISRLYVHQYPFEILQLPGRVVMVFEYDHFVRQVWTDGRQHPSEDELDATWMGHSIGTWDGDTFVVDSIGFNDKTWLDSEGHPHTEALHLVERLRRVDHDTLQIDFTFDDPKAYTRPWTAQRVFRLRPGWEISEQVCPDNFLWKEPGT
jgi:hypothetical protein